MIRKFQYGKPFPTESVVMEFEKEEGGFPFGEIHLEKGFHFTYQLGEDDIVYGLGEANRGINKRGYTYTSWCTDDPIHTEDKKSLYAAHNFVVVSGKKTFGMYLDYPSKLTFDIGYTRCDWMEILCERADLDIYLIEGDNPYDIVKKFRKMIGRSYIPPKFAFGYGQSRWGNIKAEDFLETAIQYRKHHIPVDMIYMDIDYAESYKDFTINPKEFPDFKAYVDQMKEMKIHLVPIIDAGVKVEEGYDIYDEGVEQGYFCKREDGSEFLGVVWPGWTHFPDVLNPKAREWFGSKYDILVSKGIDGFWNDMNEPAIFYTKEGLDEVNEFIIDYAKDTSLRSPHEILDRLKVLHCREEDYKNFYHETPWGRKRHDEVHNLYGYNLTKAAAEALEKISPDKRILLFSRASYIGMHRYGGVWTGDNHSWWSHILLNLKMVASLNMCGFLYSGADIGGFGENTSRELLLRWLALGVFTPLMRNHTSWGTRRQECYQFERLEDFKAVVGTRYRLLPYIYSEYMKATLNDDLYFKPLAFVYSEDNIALRIEDQLMVGNEIMIAPVYEQNARGRVVYLPEEMKLLKFSADDAIYEEVLTKGHHYIEIALNEVPVFVRKDKKIPVVPFAEYVDAIDMSQLTYYGYEDASYELYDDDGISRIE